MTIKEVEKLIERTKDDREMIVGSEVREVCVQALKAMLQIQADAEMDAEIEKEMAKPDPERERRFLALNRRMLDKINGYPDGPRKCMICALDKTVGVFDSVTAACVCIECRDRARREPERRGCGTDTTYG
jgi:hypothetical protein